MYIKHALISSDYVNLNDLQEIRTQSHNKFKKQKTQIIKNLSLNIKISFQCKRQLSMPPLGKY